MALGRRFLATTTTTTTTTTDDHRHYMDVLIVGGGVVGCSLARQLVKQCPRLAVGLVDAKSLPPPTPSNLDATTTAPPHPRSYALSPASLEWLGLTDKSDNHPRLGYYRSMQVWEAGHPASLLFSHQDLPNNASHLGAVVEDAVILEHLWKEILQQQEEQQQNQLVTFSNSTISQLSFSQPPQQSEWVEVQLKPAASTSSARGGGKPEAPKNSQSTDTTTTTIRTKLLVGADGAQSAVRQLAGISRRVHEYPQHALTFTVQLQSQQSHHQRAFQRFLANDQGVLALLPTFSPQHAIVVWSTTPDRVQYWKKQSTSAAFMAHLNDLLQTGPERVDTSFLSLPPQAPAPLRNLAYGAEKLLELAQYGPALLAQQQPQGHDEGFSAPPLLDAIASPCFSFPLTCATVASYTAPRVALIGDAAHSVHPMAGQGLNLGLQDAAHLWNVSLQRAHEAGMHDASLFLADYERGRHVSVASTVHGIHALHGAFSSSPYAQHALAKHVKSVGLNVIQNVAPLRQVLARAACHGVGPS